MQVVPVPLTMLAGMATLRISIPTDLRPPEARKATLLTLRARPSTGWGGVCLVVEFFQAFEG